MLPFFALRRRMCQLLQQELHVRCPRRLQTLQLRHLRLPRWIHLLRLQLRQLRLQLRLLRRLLRTC